MHIFSFSSQSKADAVTSPPLLLMHVAPRDGNIIYVMVIYCYTVVLNELDRCMKACIYLHVRICDPTDPTAR